MKCEVIIIMMMMMRWECYFLSLSDSRSVSSTSCGDIGCTGHWVSSVVEERESDGVLKRSYIL